MRTGLKRRKIKEAVSAFAVIFIVVVCAVFGNMIQEDSLMQTVIRQGKSEGYVMMLKSMAPSLLYESKEVSLAEYITQKVFHMIPVYGYLTDSQDYATQMESAISYDTIVAKEASDESYVDETTGNVVDSKEVALTENKNEEKAQETKETEEPQNAKPTQSVNATASAFVPNQTPVVTYSAEKLNDFDYLIQNFYVVDRTTTINSSQLNAADLLSRSMKLTHGADAPQILIYHTHSQEGFADSVPGDPATSIVGVGEYLTQLLGGYGFHVLHHTGEYDVDSRDDAYSKAGPAVEQILKENPSIEIVIDLHRDGVAEGTHLVTDVQGKQTASIMFFNGLSRTTANGDIGYLYNPYIQDNLAFSLQMQIAADEYYPGFSRAIYLKGYRYNMHYCPKTLLVEVGAQTNTVQEAMNAMEPLADIIAKVISPN